MENENTVNLDAKLSALTRFEDGIYVDADILANVLEEHLKAEDRSDFAKISTAVICTRDALANPKYGETIGFQDPKDNWKFNFVENPNWEKVKEDFLMSEYESDESTKAKGGDVCLPEEKTQPEVKTTSEPNYKGVFLAGFIGGAATALGKFAVDLLAPKVKEASEKFAEKAKARRAERKKLKEQKKLEALIEAEKAKTE